MDPLMTADSLSKQNQPRPKVIQCSIISYMEFKMYIYIYIYFHIYQYIIKNLEQCVAEVSRFLISSTLLESGLSVAVTKQWSRFRVKEDRELRGEAREGRKQCFLYSSQLFQTPKKLWGHTPNATVPSQPQSKQTEGFLKRLFISILSIKNSTR